MASQNSPETRDESFAEEDALEYVESQVVEPLAVLVSETGLGAPGSAGPEKALPYRKGDITRLLQGEPGLSDSDRSQLDQFAKLLGATINHEFSLRLHELKELYAPLDPDSEFIDLPGYSKIRRDESDEQFLSGLELTLEKANYQALTLSAIEEAVSTPNERGLNYVPDFSLFEHLKVFVRGQVRITREYRSVHTKFRKHKVTLDAHGRMILALKFREGGKDLGPFVRTDVVYIRMFKDVPHVDMEMHLPEQGTRVKMRWIDKAQIATPLFTGIPTVLAKFLLASAISPFLLIGLIAAPLTAGVNSFFGYQRSKRNHLYAMIHRLYYLTIGNNASVLTRVIDSASDEEYKEALLAYFFLWRALDDPTHWDMQRLDSQVEAFLHERTGAKVDFEVDDALDKLLRLGIARKDHAGKVQALPIAEALAILDRRWDDTFRYDGALEDH